MAFRPLCTYRACLFLIALSGTTGFPLVKAVPRKYPAVLSIPKRSETVRLPSPDGRWTLICTSFRDPAPMTLRLRDHRSGSETTLAELNGDGSIGWSPDSQAFIINTELASNARDARVTGPAYPNRCC